MSFQDVAQLVYMKYFGAQFDPSRMAGKTIDDLHYEAYRSLGGQFSRQEYEKHLLKFLDLTVPAFVDGTFDDDDDGRPASKSDALGQFSRYIREHTDASYETERFFVSIDAVTSFS